MQKGTKQMFSHLDQTSLFNKGFYCIAKKRTLTCRINVGNLFVGQTAKRYESLILYSGTSARTKRVQWSPIPKRGFTFCLVTFLVPLQEQPPPPPSTPIGQIFDGELMQHLEICLCTDYLPGNLFSFQLSFY